MKPTKLCLSIILFFTLSRPCQALPFNSQIEKIAFGSCNKEDKSQPLWQEISKNQPDLFIWSGDVVYADSMDRAIRTKIFNKQLTRDDYQSFIKSTSVSGTWDDHDYADNDSDRTAKNRPMLQETFLDFLQVDSADPRRSRPGIYTEEIYGDRQSHIRIVYLDTRYFKSPWEDDSKGTILGDLQWSWLENNLRSSRAVVHIVVSSIQVIPNQHRFERWGRFDNERRRLLELLSKVSNPIIISGDRHIAEISRIEIGGMTIHEITSSGMTHSYTGFSSEDNRHRVGSVVSKLNYGMLTFDWEANQVMAGIYGPNETLYQSLIWTL